MRDKRRCPRYGVELPVSFKLSGAKGSVSFAKTINVSATGIFLFTHTELNVGEEINLQVKLPSGEKVSIFTNVVRVTIQKIFGRSEYKVGLKINDAMKGDEAVFVKFCAGLMMKESKLKPKKGLQE